ncbi:MAG: hypothetical protein ACUVXG_11145 [Anaerolineae bacterium]
MQDIPAIVACQRAAYPGLPESSYDSERTFRMQLETFPEGQFLAEVEGQVAGYVTSLVVQLGSGDDYTRSTISTPSDFAFPLEAIAAEADANVETVVITDLDLDALAQQRDIGSVRPLYDRRLDLYDVRARVPVQVVCAE